MNNVKYKKVMKATARKLVIIYLSFFLALPINAVERIRYIHTDIVGSPSAATDESGEVLLWREYYRPYGERIIDEADDNRVWFTGKLEQSKIGLNYHGARWYDPMVGRFSGNDPVGVDPNNFNTFNRYCYANNNPYRYTDPDGRMAIVEGAFLGLVIFVGISIYSESKRASINTFPSHEGGYGHYGGQSIDTPSSWSTISPISGWDVPTWMSSDRHSEDDSDKYDDYWDKQTDRAPPQSNPYDVIPRYDENGDYKGATTYDRYGNRSRQHEWGDNVRHGEGYHEYDNSGNTGGVGNHPRSEHIKY